MVGLAFNKHLFEMYHISQSWIVYQMIAIFNYILKSIVGGSFLSHLSLRGYIIFHILLLSFFVM